MEVKFPIIGVSFWASPRACFAARPSHPTVTPPVAERSSKITDESKCEGVADLPCAQGKSFGTLDEYLAHLEQLGAVDLPWWREIEPGLFEHQIRMTGAEREIATRAELMRRFGFDR